MSAVIDYIKESYDELVHKVTWPSSRDVANSAIVVLIASLLIALVIFAMDQAFEHVMRFIYEKLF